MKTVAINTSQPYDVLIGSGLLSQLGQALRSVTKASRTAIISDSNVWPIYREKTRNILDNAGYETLSFVFPAGEANKNGQTYLQLLNFLAENHLTRSDCLVALGGGVVGDLAGFAAATYQRGIDFVQIPTTLLAAVDSSVGGKTAIDLPSGKNLAGAFYQPKLVLCDTDTLNTLPAENFLDGCGEVIKYGVLYDGALFSHLLEKGIDFDREEVISRCVELKRDVVSADEFDRGERQKLNLGHTVGHAIEKCSEYTVPHGKAVAMGMAVVSKAAASQGLCSEETAGQIMAILNRFGISSQIPYSAQQLYLAALSDKKRSGALVNLIIPRFIGNCTIHPISVDALKSFLEAGL